MAQRTRRILEKLRDIVHTHQGARDLDRRLCAVLAESPPELLDTVEQYCIEADRAVWRRYALLSEAEPMGWRLWWRLRAMCELVPREICVVCKGHGDTPGIFGPMECKACEGTGISGPAMLAFRTPVTMGQWRSAGFRSYRRQAAKDHPVTTATWYEAIRYCNRISADINSFLDARRLKMAYRTSGGDEEARRENLRLVEDATGFQLPTSIQWRHLADEPPDPETCKRCMGIGWRDDEDRCFLCMGTGMTTHDINAAPRNHAENNPPLASATRPNKWGLRGSYGLAWEWCWQQAPNAFQRPCMGGFATDQDSEDEIVFESIFATEQIDSPMGLRPILLLTPLDD